MSHYLKFNTMTVIVGCEMMGLKETSSMKEVLVKKLGNICLIYGAIAYLTTVLAGFSISRPVIIFAEQQPILFKVPRGQGGITG